MAIGASGVGFVNTWWAFQMLWTPFAGIGFSLANTAANIVCDRYATQDTRPTVNALKFSLDQLALMMAGVLYGKLYGVAKVENNGAIMWLPAAGFGFLMALSIIALRKFIPEPYDKLKKQREEKQ